jgi:hypothetical protein
MHMILVFDIGPARDDPERKKFERENGGANAVVEVRTSQREIMELDSRRYLPRLPAGMTVTARRDLG